MNIDVKGISIDPVSLGDIVRLELEKNKSISVVDRYEMEDLLKKNSIDINGCYGKSCVIEAGQILKVDKMLYGSAEVIGDKIVITLRSVDIASGETLKTEVDEFVNREELLNLMVSISVNNIFNIENDQTFVDQLTKSKELIEPVTNRYRLNGPRIGIAYVTGDYGDIITKPKPKGGFDGYPVLSQIGYQFEIQYIGAGNFSALVEVLGMVSGLEQQIAIPTLILTNGFRFNKQGWEVAFGPTLGLRKQAKGFYDTQQLMGGERGEWYLVNEWDEQHPELPNPYENEFRDRLDTRGDVTVSPGWVWAVGKTFHSGYLNIPVNVYVAPKREGWYMGLSLGFNVTSKKQRNN